MSSRPAKRRRTENVSIVRSDRWFGDGNVVLQAGNTQFRVHWGVLALHSSIFRDMQGLPQPSDQPTVEDCPVVELSDDPEDIEYLLKALYTPTFLGQKKFPLAGVGALIRMGRKYDFKDFFESGVARLRAEYPTTFEEYEAVANTTKTIAYYDDLDFDVIALAIENNIFSVLPCAYYYLARRSLDSLFDKIEKEEGTMAVVHLIHLRRCVVGRQKLLLKQFQPGYTLGWALNGSTAPGCTVPSSASRLGRKSKTIF
ncbi:hypothetical protein B0H12DRAFT_1218768 [Mycena haematopus]|nr:hypothetical protein B0H12DRAFT_1218768 [Mycena haematopus]